MRLNCRTFLLGGLDLLCAGVLGLLIACSAHAELDLSPIDSDQWNAQLSAHLLSRAGFGGQPSEVEALASLSPENAVALMIEGTMRRSENSQFEHSEIFDQGLDPFPASRPATTRLAKLNGEALGIKIKPGGNRPLQPVVNKFFYWLRASRLETDRVAYWWANRMLTSEHPLVEKMALFWHGHFATNEDKVRDYRKMLKQLELFQSHGLGGFRELLIAVAQDPAMLVFLDAGVNTKDSPNENFAREIMELFSMGVGNYTERDVQEAARAFTGWNVRNLEFVVDQDHHDSGQKEFLGQRGNFDGVAVIDLILQDPISAQFVASKLYRYFVSDTLAAEDEVQLGALFDALDFNVAQFLRVLFLSKDFYGQDKLGARIKSPVEMMISTYRKMGLNQVPGVPDFNMASGALGQRLMHPPTVAGWSEGRSWITPSLMFERGNFVLDVLFPDIGFVPPDRYPAYTAEVVNVQDRLRQGMGVTAATKPTGVADTGDMAASNMLADADEDFNTRLGSMRGWQMALERVRPISRHTARINLTDMVLMQELATPDEVIAYWEKVYFSVPLTDSVKAQLAVSLAQELGTQDLQEAASYMEEGLRKVLHKMLSLPEYQLG
ncbi:MAG: DUF1800 domain-containing protein [Pseudomonadota bacterium]